MNKFLLFLLWEVILSHLIYGEHQQSCKLIPGKYEICEKYEILMSVKEDNYYKLH